MSYTEGDGNPPGECPQTPRVSHTSFLPPLGTSSSEGRDVEGESLRDYTMTYRSCPTESYGDQPTEPFGQFSRPLTSWEKLALKPASTRPTYNVRTVVHVSEHPLWSKSLKTRLDYLVGDALRKLGTRYSNNRGSIIRPTSFVGCTSVHTQGPPVNYPTAPSPWGNAFCNHGIHISDNATETRVASSASSGWGPSVFVPGRASRLSADFANHASLLDEARFKRRTILVNGEWKSLGPRELATLRLSYIREELVARETIVDEEHLEAVKLFSQHLGALHLVDSCDKESEYGEPVQKLLQDTMLNGLQAINYREEINRSYVLEEENKAFQPIWDLFVFVHRGMLLGSAPLKNYLRRWVYLTRGRKERYRVSLQQLHEREEKSRSEIMEEHASLEQELFSHLLSTMETLFRVELESFQLLTQVAQVHAWLFMQSQVDVYPKLYGIEMTRRLVCGRATGVTLFRELVLRCQNDRDALALFEERGRTVLRCAMELDDIALFSEEIKRRSIEEEENAERAKKHLFLFVLMERCHAREVEIIEACEWDVDLMRKFREGCLAIGEKRSERNSERKEGHGEEKIEENLATNSVKTDG